MIPLIDNDKSEHYIKRGDPNKATYYIIRQQNTEAGLFWYFAMVAGHIRYAMSNGWLPVVDMQNYPNPYLAPDKLGKENAWEYYFEQPLKINLEQAYSGENVILSATENESVAYPDLTMRFFENKNNVLTEWRTLVKFGLLKVKPALVKEASAIRDKLFTKTDRVLGVKLRGTDYLANKPKWYPIPPTAEFATNVILSKLTEHKCNKIFLATEDKNIEQTLKNTFGDLCVTFDKKFVDYVQGKPITACRIDRENDNFLQGKEYLIEMLLLSKCNSLVLARSFGAVGVMMLSEAFEHTYFFNFGRYGIYGGAME